MARVQIFLLKVKRLGQALLSIPIILSLVYGCTTKIDEHGNFPTQKLVSEEIEGISFAIHYSEVIRFLEKNGIKYQYEFIRYNPFLMRRLYLTILY